MKFPIMYNIASTSVIHVDITSSLKTALSLMLEHNHRNIIVIDSDCFRILTIVDILNIQRKGINLDIKLSELNLSKVPTIDKDKNVLDTIDILQNSITNLHTSIKVNQSTNKINS